MHAHAVRLSFVPRPHLRNLSDQSGGLIQIDCSCVKCNYLIVTLYSKLLSLIPVRPDIPWWKKRANKIIFHFFALKISLLTCDASFCACTYNLMYQASRVIEHGDEAKSDNVVVYTSGIHLSPLCRDNNNYSPIVYTALCENHKFINSKLYHWLTTT